jgi:hypothetical protein
MEKDTETENPEDLEPLDSEEHSSEKEERTEEFEEYSADSETGFEEQEGEVLHPKKKSGAGKVFLFLILLLLGGGGYLYSNNLIPAKILELVLPKPSPSPPIISKVPRTPFPLEEKFEEPEQVSETSRVAELIEKKVLHENIPEAPTTKVEEVTEVQEPIKPDSSTSGNQETTHVSGKGEKTETAVHISGREGEIVETQEENPESSEVTSQLSDSVSESSEPASGRDESTQAYLDFIESSAQKLGELIKEGIIWGWRFLKEQLG